MVLEKRGACIGVVGTTNTGKTTTLRAIVNANTKKRFVCYGSYDSENQWILGHWKGETFHHEPSSLNVAETAFAKSLGEIRWLLEKRKFRNVVFCGDATIDEWCKYCVENVSGVSLMLDEIDACHEIRRVVRNLPMHWTRLVSKGRHIHNMKETGLSLVWACQKMSRVHQDVIDEQKASFMHRLASEVQRKRLQGFFEFDVDLSILGKLPKGAAYFSNQGLNFEPVTAKHLLEIGEYLP